MLKRYALFLLILTLSSCNDASKINFERLQISNEQGLNAPLVEIDIPKAVKETKLDKEINSVIQKKLVTMLVYDETLTVETIADAMHSFKRGFFDIKDKFPNESTARWEAKISGTVLFENKNVLTIALNSYIFTGGAHGYESTSLLNFDKKKGKQLRNKNLVLDIDAFVSYAENKFRVQEKIPLDGNINDTGFMFESEEFELPDNVGYTKDGLQLLYNVYEVSSYADGQIILTLPYKEVAEFLKIKDNKE